MLVQITLLAALLAATSTSIVMSCVLLKMDDTAVFVADHVICFDVELLAMSLNRKSACPNMVDDAPIVLKVSIASYDHARPARLAGGVIVPVVQTLTVLLLMMRVRILSVPGVLPVVNVPHPLILTVVPTATVLAGITLLPIAVADTNVTVPDAAAVWLALDV